MGVGLKQQKLIFSQVWMLEVQNQDASMVGFMLGEIGVQRESTLSGISSYKGTNPIMGAPPS